jgi:hypothetical protein
MKTTKMNRIKIAAFGILLSAAFNASAQKLADVQAGSVWAGAPVKVDGNAADWASGLKAANKSTHLSYTMANDEKYLYLLIQSNDQQTNGKIMLGGITLVVNTDNKKKDKDAFAVTYPLVIRQRGQRGGGGAVTARANGGGFGGGGREAMTQAQRDSMQLAARKAQLEASKEIGVTGFKDITDSIISIYNEYGVKASAVFDNDNNFVYELAVPLASLGLSVDKPKEFSYQVKVNGLVMGGGGGGQRGGGGGFGGFGGGGGGFGGGQRGGGGGGRGNDMMAMSSPTDFWGKYTLAAKP